MITSVIGDAAYITVTGGSSPLSYINQNADIPMQGAIRISGSTLQVFNTNMWINVTLSSALVSLSGHTRAAIEWAQIKMQEELELAHVIKLHPHLSDAVKEVEHAKQMLQTLITLTKETT